MSSTEAKIKISIKDGEFELSGSELFVSQQIDNLREVIESALASANRPTAEAALTAEESADSSDLLGPPAAPHEEANSPAPSYPNVLHIDNGKVSILKSMPGGNNAKKSVNTALAYLWGMKSLGIDEVAYGDIRDLCSSQGCLDSNNFSSHMKSARQYFIVDGKKGSSAKTCKLTIPGIDEAKRLLGDLNGD